MLARFLFLTMAVLMAACSKAEAQFGEPKVLVDQFGYLPSLEKRAVIRDPQRGFDAGQSFMPGGQYAVVNVRTGKTVYQGRPMAWENGKIDDASGDRTWMFDFSAVKTPGRYVIRDIERRHDSYPFEIDDNVYKPVLKAALKTFYLQRAGIEKTRQYAGNWADGASHMQDARATAFLSKGDKRTARDLRGGWYDAGDYNQYTSWTADYITILLMAYQENPTVWTDDFGIPESGNGTPDILDEVKWGLGWLSRMQNNDGSVLSILGRDSASPPSAAKGASYYGPANTSATIAAAGAFAIAAKVYGNKTYEQRAVRAWDWANNHPVITFKNNEEAYKSVGLGAGQQEVGPERLNRKRLISAIHLYAVTRDRKYLQEVERLYQIVKPIKASTLNDFESHMAFDMLYFAQLPGVSARFEAQIKRDYDSQILNAYNGWPTIRDDEDPYGAFTDGYWWGSNGVKARRGSVYTQATLAGIGNRPVNDYLNAGSRYLHYLHGVNPMGKAYLSNMIGFGAENSVNSFYHAWFVDGSRDYDDVRTSKYGPAPGFLVGGPNDRYQIDECCPRSCGDKNGLCRVNKSAPPFSQPPAKSYRDFNDGWPVNSWEVTENSNGYQVAYIRLLSKYAR